MEENKRPRWWRLLPARERRLTLIISAILLIGLALMYGGGLFGGLSSSSPAAPAASERLPQAIAAGEEELEAKLLRILSAVEGAGRVEVALNFSESAAAEYAVNIENSFSESSETDDAGGAVESSQRSERSQLAEINSAPVLLKETMPRLAGAVIVAEGAGDPYVREKLHRAARVLLNLPANRIEVIKSNEGGSI